MTVPLGVRLRIGTWGADTQPRASLLHTNCWCPRMWLQGCTLLLGERKPPTSCPQPRKSDESTILGV